MATSNIPRRGGYFTPQSCICSVQYTGKTETESQTGTGAFYGAPGVDGTATTLFMTNFHVAPIKELREVTNIKLVFEDPTIGNINLTPDWVKNWWTSEKCDCKMEETSGTMPLCGNLDVTVIELSTIAIKVLSRTNFTTLTITLPKWKESISVFPFPGGVLKVGKGFIKSTHGPKFKYSVTSEAGSSGSPILSDDFQAVGIHSGQNPDGTRKGINICAINQRFIIYKKEVYQGKVESEKELEWINQIPKGALTLIEPGGTGRKAQFGYGKVYKVTEKDNDGKPTSSVALKIIEGFGGLDIFKDQVEELKKEYDSVALLQHPRIIKLFAFVKDDLHAKLILKMEYLDGGSLAEKINAANGGKLDLETSLKYLIQIVEGVSFLHYKNKFHGDIKPSNVLFTEKGNIKLSDIGIAVRLQFASSTTSGQKVLRRDCYYMSPERINGDPLSAADDIWSIGATFVKMITGNTINYKEKFPDINRSIAQYKILIDDQPLTEYLASIKDTTDYRKKILSPIFSRKESRLDAEALLALVYVCGGIPLSTLEERFPVHPQDDEKIKTTSLITTVNK